jgi:hypothetical protein
MQAAQLLTVIELLAVTTTLCLVFKVVTGLLTGGLGGPVMYCPECTFEGQGRTHLRGSFRWELLLWCLFIIPGLAYNIWRIGDTNRVCARCHYGGLVVRDMPLA